MSVPNILIAEDNQGTANMLKILLELEGYQVSTVQESQLVLSALEQQCPDVMLLDFHLGYEDAAGLLQSIRSRPEFEQLPIVVISGMELSWEAEEAGADVFLLKPFGADELFVAMREAMSRHQSH